jgi:hypothetical protein
MQSECEKATSSKDSSYESKDNSYLVNALFRHFHLVKLLIIQGV